MGDQLTDQPETSAEPTEPKGHGPFSLLFWSLTILGLYVLSSGPATKLYYSVPKTRPVILVLYAPLSALCDVCPPAQRAMLWYAATVWGVKVK
jgi:hypothetical protein